MWSDWLVFCDCGFQSGCPLMEKDKRLMNLPDGRDWLRGKLGLVLMGRAMLSKSLPQFSVEGRGCVPSLLFDLRPNCGGGNAAFLSKTIFPEVFLFRQVDWLFIKELPKGSSQVFNGKQHQQTTSAPERLWISCLKILILLFLPILLWSLPNPNRLPALEGPPQIFSCQ